MKILIIGAVAAGMKAASKARRCDPDAEITVLEKGEVISYGACGLPYYVSGEVHGIDELMKTSAGLLRDAAYFHDVKNIKVLTQTLALGIDRKAKTVSARNLDTGEEFVLPYDKLVLATGASPLKPEFQGVGLDNVFPFWYPKDAVEIRQGLKKGKYKNAVIVGAGLVGMEMAEAFATWGINVAVVEMKEHVLPAFLDAEISGMIEKYLLNEDINLLTNEKVIRFDGDAAVTGVVTDKRTIPADIVVMSLGVRPNIELAKAAGLEIGETGAIAVNPMMQTSDPDIFAGGDCTENINMVTGRRVFAPMGSTANKHGRIIGENLFGAKHQFKGVLNTAVVKILDFNVGKTGFNEQEAKALGFDYIAVTTAGLDKPHYMEGSKLITIKLLADPATRKVLGAQAVGEGDVSKRIDVIASVLTFGGTIDDLFDIDLSYAPPYNSPIDNAAVAANVMMNKLEGKFKGISSLEAKDMMKDEKIVFLDVRTPVEWEKSRLAGTKNIINIPLSDLRKRSGELNKDAEIVAYCKVSLRGYEAAGILEGEAFKNVKVMEGGLFSWPFEEKKD